MFAAASGARLAHRHNKTVKKPIGSSQYEECQVHNREYQRQQQPKCSDIHGLKYPGISQKRLAYSYKLYASNYNPGLKLSATYIDINGRIPKLGHYDFESKAAWQDRELCQEIDRRESISVPSEVHATSKFKQKEAHRRWMRRNRIQDLSLKDSSSEDELLYGVQNGAANLLLYVGLGTMCIGMIIAFVGTGEKGFKTMELRLIGPSLIGAGVLIIILRVLLCVCPSKCLQLNKDKHKLKNSTNKLNSEGNEQSVSPSEPREEAMEEAAAGKSSMKGTGECNKKRVSIAALPMTSSFNANFPTSSFSNFNLIQEQVPGKGAAAAAGTLPHHRNSLTLVQTISFVENEKPSSSKSYNRKLLPKSLTSGETKVSENDDFGNIELKELNGNEAFDAFSIGSGESSKKKYLEHPSTAISPEASNVPVNSIIKISKGASLEEKPVDKTRASAIETGGNFKSQIYNELVLNPSAFQPN